MTWSSEDVVRSVVRLSGPPASLALPWIAGGRRLARRDSAEVKSRKLANSPRFTFPGAVQGPISDVLELHTTASGDSARRGL